MEDICIAPWNMLRIEFDGDCYICTNAFHTVSLGNIFEKTLDEIWNGETAKQIRRDIIQRKEYKYCRTELCHRYINEVNFRSVDFDNFEISDYPTVIYFVFDISCSQKCIFCRDSIKIFSKEEEQKWERVIREKIFPIINKVKVMELNHAGEIMDSPFSKKLIKQMLEINSDLKFNIISNGLNLTKENLECLGLNNKMQTVRISIHSSTSRTYGEIFRGENVDYRFNRVLNNLEYLKQLKEEKKINEFEMMFVICSINYKEIPNFIKFAESYTARASFSLMTYTGNCRYGQEYLNYQVFSPSHHKYNDFVRTIKKIPSKYHSSFPPCVFELEYVSFLQIIKNYIAYYKWKKTRK